MSIGGLNCVAKHKEVAIVGKVAERKYLCVYPWGGIPAKTAQIMEFVVSSSNFSGIIGELHNYRIYFLRTVD